MKVLLVHSDFIEYEALEKAVKQAEEVKEKKKRVEECLVVFVSFEQEDDERLLEKFSEEIEDVSTKLKVKRVVLYPWVHLSAKPSSPARAYELLVKAEEVLKSKGFEVCHAPFGWYKSFEIRCKGHPLSELSREIKAGEEESKALKAERKISSRWFIITPEGELHEIKAEDGEVVGFDFKSYENLKKFAAYEISKSRKVNQEPPHIKLMRGLELVDYEPASDPGNLRYYPKGKLIKSLLEEFVTRKTLEYGAMEIESPIMYDYNHPTLKKYLDRFPARQYTITTPNKKVFLRFAACFGQFLMLHDAVITYKHLPLRLYELTKYSFRVEQRGELAGLRRLRAFTMPDCHALCKDMNQAKEEMLRRFELSEQIQKEIGFSVPEDFEFAIRATKDFLEKEKEFIVSLVKKWGKPALLEVWDERIFYFVLKYEWNFVDSLGKAAALNTDQIDVVNAENYDISFVDSDGKKKRPIIMHLSPSGAIERVMYALLEKAAIESKKGKKPELPLWLSPTQLRLVPVSEDYVDYCLKLLEKIKGVRVDIDDTNDTLSKKIRKAEKEWIPYIAVVGEKEVESGKLSVRIRNESQKQCSIEEIAEEIKEKTKGMPFKPLPMPVLLSKRPVFVGSS